MPVTRSVTIPSLRLLLGAIVQLVAFHRGLLGDERPRNTLVVQPIIVRGDDGMDPAPYRLSETNLDRIFGMADVDIHLLDPLWMNDTAARDGQDSVETIAQRARDTYLSRGPDHILSLFFLRSIPNNSAGTTQAVRQGSELFVAIGEQSSDLWDTYHIARGMATFLGLSPLPKSAPIGEQRINLMGGAEFDPISATHAELRADQIAQLGRHPLVRPHIHCLSLDEARQMILDESYEPYFSQMQRREIGALTGESLRETDLEACRNEARRRFADNVIAFSDREAEGVAWIVDQVEHAIGEQYPLYRRQPWRFMKFSNRLCGGFPHTRGDCILLSERVVEGIVAERHTDLTDPSAYRFASLFIHEQMHVLERLYPERFAILAQSAFRLVRADVVDHAWLAERQIQNPDALRLEWLIPFDNEAGERQLWWPRTILAGDAEVPRMGQDFQPIAVRVEPHEGSYHVVTDAQNLPETRPLQSFASFFGTFRVGVGQDHPNEIAAYASDQLLRDAVSGTVEPANLAPESNDHDINRAYRSWCQQYLQ